jgi:hypothetical protein
LAFGVSSAARSSSAAGGAGIVVPAFMRIVDAKSRARIGAA